VTSSVGRISFGVDADASGLSAELQRAIAPALAAAQAKLNREPLTVPIKVGTIDTRAAVAAAQAKLNRANLRVDAKVNLKLTAAQEATLARLESLTDKRVRLDFSSNLNAEQIRQIRSLNTAIGGLDSKRVRLDFSTNISADLISQLRNAASAIRRLESRDVDVSFFTNLDEDTVRALRNASSAIRRLDNKNIVVRIDLQVDEAQLERVALLLRSMRDTSVNVRVNSNADSITTHVRSLNRELGYMPGLAGGIAGISAALAAITGAAGAALGAVGGLAIGIAALGPAAAAIGATLFTGLQGIGDAFTAMGNEASNAATEAAAQSEAIASANDQLASANDAAAASQEALDSALRDSARAAADVADAYVQAERDLRNYQLTAQEAALDEREAAFALEDAQKALLKARNPDEHERALLRVQKAELNLVRAQDASKKAAQENAEAQEKGIENSDAVTEARDKQSQANQRVIQAERQAAASARAVDAATRALTKATTEGTTSSQKFNQALAELSPNAREFVLAAKDAKPAWDAFSDSIQDSLFENLGRELSETANVVLPAIKDSMKGVASELNAAAINAADFVQSARGIDLINSSMNSATNLLRGMRSGTGELTQGWIDFTHAAEPAMEGIGRAIAGLGEGIGRALTAANENGELTALFEGFRQTLEGMGPFLEDFIGSLITIGNEVLPTLGPFFTTLGDTLREIAPELGSIGAVFVNSLTAILPSLGDLIEALATGLEPVLPVITSLIKTLADALVPLMPIFGEIANTVGTALIDLVTALEPALPPLAQAFSDLLTAVLPIVTLIGDNLSTVLQAIAPALSEIFVALTPVIQQFADGMAPVIKEIAPVLKDVAIQLGVAIADAIQQLMPFLPELIQAFSDLILAIVPILPELMDLAVMVIPILTDALVDIAPILIEMANVFVWVVENIIEGVVIPAINFMQEQWGNLFDAIGTAIDWVQYTAFPKLGEALESVKGWFGSAIDWIGRKWDELGGIAAKPVNFVIDTVWNNGLLKAWQNIDNLLGGVLPDAAPIALIPEHHATGGRVGYLHGGAGNGTKDDILSWMSNNEHVFTSDEVLKAGGHNILMAIRDMISRGVPFTWDGGKVISELGRANLSRYGAAVSQQGVGNVDPAGLFDPLFKAAGQAIPGYRAGGPVFPWMHQLAAGHDFARAQNGKPYQWAGPTGPGSSFDCSGFMGSVAAAILGANPWQRYWATSSFAGYPGVGPQGFRKNLLDGVGMVIGVTDDPGGPGGGHTAGELRPIPELGYPAARIESGGALGDVHYGRGTPVNTFDALYGLAVGANGFFQPSTGGGGSVGPSPGEQSSFLTSTIERMVKAITDPIRGTIDSVIGKPPPAIRGIPTGVLNAS
jgi:phage-related protein